MQRLLDHDGQPSELFFLLAHTPHLQQSHNLLAERVEPVLHALAQEAVLLLQVVEQEVDRVRGNGREACGE